MKVLIAVKNASVFACVLGAFLMLSSCSAYKRKVAEKKAIQLIMDYEQTVIPLNKCENLSLWQITQGSPMYVFDRLLDIRYEKALYFSNKGDFEITKELYESGNVKDQYLSHQLSNVYYNRLFHQVDSTLLYQINSLEVYLYKMITTYNPQIDGKATTIGIMDRILQTETNTEVLKKAWKAQKNLGSTLKDSMLNLVRIRNSMAQKAGFKDYYHYKIVSAGQNIDSIEKWFHSIELATREPYAKIKKYIDYVLSEKYGVETSKLQAWHYQSSFFQEMLNVYDMDQGRSYKNKNVANITNCFYAGMGLDIDGIIQQSDLKKINEKKQYSICFDIDRLGDIRLLCSLGHDLGSMNEMLRQTAYAAYLKNISPTLPYLLRDFPDPILKEGVAMLFRRFSSNVSWLQGMGITRIAMGEKIAINSVLNLRAQQILFSRWSQVMYHFEKEMYRDPEQDLNALWWKLVSKYQLLPIPELRNDATDWASKIHLVAEPCYYHNYLLGEVLASSLNAYICNNIIKDSNYWAPYYINQESVGKFFCDKIFCYGAAYPWTDILKDAIGKEFTIDDYCKEVVRMDGYGKIRDEHAAEMKAIKRKYLKQ